MAGGGTGAFGGPGGVKPTVPTPTKSSPNINFNFTTAGTTPFTMGKGNPFGPGFILPSEAAGGYEWKMNYQQVEPIAISLIGDRTGRYIPSAFTGEGSVAGAPLTREEAIAKIITDTAGKPGGILALKKQLDEKQFYGNPKAGQQSLLSGDAVDGNFYAALSFALDQATAFNADLAAKQGNVTNPKIYSFEQYLAEAPKSGLYSSTSFGGGGGGKRTTITNQKFNPEDFDVAIDQLFQQTVGRGATEEELADFVGKLQSYEKKNPQKTVSVTSGNTTKTTQSGGVSADIMQSMMRDEALANPEAENYNKATKYLSYFMEALDNPIELG